MRSNKEKKKAQGGQEQEEGTPPAPSPFAAGGSKPGAPAGKK